MKCVIDVIIDLTVKYIVRSLLVLCGGIVSFVLLCVLLCPRVVIHMYAISCNRLWRTLSFLILAGLTKHYKNCTFSSLQSHDRFFFLTCSRPLPLPFNIAESFWSTSNSIVTNNSYTMFSTWYNPPRSISLVHSLHLCSLLDMAWKMKTSGMSSVSLQSCSTFDCFLGSLFGVILLKLLNNVACNITHSIFLYTRQIVKRARASSNNRICLCLGH